MTPAYRRKYRKQPTSPVAPPIYQQYQPPQYLEVQNEDEVENNFHEDRRRNLQSFFKDDTDHQNPALVGRFHDYDDTGEEVSDRIVPTHPMFGSRDNEDNEETTHDNDDFESNFGSEGVKVCIE